MRRLIYIVLGLLLCSPVSAQFILEPFTVQPSPITLPDVVTPDGVKVPAGVYSVLVHHEAMLVQVSPPSVTLGTWSGPLIELFRLDSDNRVINFTFETQIEVRILYGPPATPDMRPGLTSGRPLETAPMIRRGRLVGIMIGQQVLRIQQAHAAVAPAGSYVMVPNPG